MIPSPLISSGYRELKGAISEDTPVTSDSRMFTSSPFFTVRMSVTIQADSSTPVTNRAGVPSCRTPLFTRPCWLNSAMVLVIRAEVRSWNSSSCQQ